MATTMMEYVAGDPFWTRGWDVKEGRRVFRRYVVGQDGQPVLLDQYLGEES